MAISQNKKELEKKKEKKRLDKLKRKEERKASGSASFDDMIAYVDENGLITNTPPSEQTKQKIELEDILISTPKMEEQEIQALEGRIEYLNAEKGYGFIKTLSKNEKYFFLSNNAVANIAEGNTVNFELERGLRGMNAIKIILARP